MTASNTPSRTLRLWYVLMGAGGFAFGLVADRRPFGADVLVHPLVVYFIIVGIGLIALRVACKRPVPEIISERAMLLGVVLGLALFLGGNFLAVHGLR